MDRFECTKSRIVKRKRGRIRRRLKVVETWLEVACICRNDGVRERDEWSERRVGGESEDGGVLETAG